MSDKLPISILPPSPPGEVSSNLSSQHPVAGGIFTSKKKSRLNDIVGNIFTRLTVLGFSHRNKWGASHWRCQCSCGKIITVNSQSLFSGDSKSCGCLHREYMSAKCRAGGASAPQWKGGRHIDRAGYVIVWNEGYFRDYKNGKVKEHRLVMEKALGRRLTREESVHHKNGNRLENLELWTGRHSNGQRVSDLLEYAKSILRQYKPDSPLLIQQAA